jgi:DNA-directed RNA polymerase specialized sigma24 family protein
MTNSQFELIKYVRIQKVANYIARQLPPGSCLDANDLAQESALKALCGRKSRAGPMLDALRKQGWIKQYRSGSGTARVELNERSCSHSPESRLAARIDVGRLLIRLTPNQRQAVELHHLAGMTESEMSALLAIPVNRIRNRIHAGLKNMRSFIQCVN